MVTSLADKITLDIYTYKTQHLSVAVVAQSFAPPNKDPKMPNSNLAGARNFFYVFGERRRIM